jgi:hypothetical protein
MARTERDRMTQLHQSGSDGATDNSGAEDAYVHASIMFIRAERGVSSRSSRRVV